MCPAGALDEKSYPLGLTDKMSCASHSAKLNQLGISPCGICIKVCPVGDDRKLFQSRDINKYFREPEILAQNPDAEEYRDWQHIRRYGGLPLADEHI